MKQSLSSRVSTHLQRRIGIDIGAGSVRLWLDSSAARSDSPDWQGIHADASCIAVDARTKRVLAVGKEAALMRGRVAAPVEVRFPFDNGVVYDMESALALLKLLLQHIIKPSIVLNTVMMVSVPASASLAERESATQLMYALGAQEVYTISQPLAAAIGAGVPIADASGSFLLHMGESKVEGAVISLGSIVAKQATTQAGEYLINRIQMRIKQVHGLRIGQQAARELLHTLASANVDSRATKLVTGQDVTNNGPKELTVSARDLHPEVQRVLGYYENVLQQLLTLVPPELTVDVIDKGLLLSGGLSHLDGLEAYLTQKMGIPVAMVDDPDLAVIRGIGTALRHLDLFKQSLGYQVE